TSALLLAALFVATGSSCAKKSTEQATQNPETELKQAPVSPETEPESFSAQVERGQQLYGEHCAKCHGADGTGGKGPAVVGQGALAKFSNAADVYAFASTKMPGDAPGSLPSDQMIAILAFDLHANGIDLEEPLS